MEAGLIMIAFVMTIVGTMSGLAIGKRRAERKYVQDTKYTQGVLNVDCSDPEFEPGMFLASMIPVSDIATRKYVILSVNVWTQNSQK